MRYLIIVGLFSCVPNVISAHPHLFVDCTLTACFDEQGLTAVEEEWTFDEMFSAAIIEEFDADQDGCFNQQEYQALKKGAFDSLKSFDYFNSIRINGETQKTTDVLDFTPRIKEGSLVYSFTVPCRVVGGAKAKKIGISIFDTTYYTAVTLDPKIRIRDSSSCWEIRSSYSRNDDFICFEESGFPETITIHVRKRE
ncbi:DUF1007 family protein [candidate division FCPU426 bacterium]|nr:DUF1007 family protein [candidate division FCPU426 bacterium]